jgi:hypothetical protein
MLESPNLNRKKPWFAKYIDVAIKIINIKIPNNIFFIVHLVFFEFFTKYNFENQIKILPRAW